MLSLRGRVRRSWGGVIVVGMTAKSSGANTPTSLPGGKL